MSVYTYASDEVRIIVGGIPISGLADGTFVSVARDEQAFTKVTGADGTTSRAKSANRSGSITLTLSQTSPSNDVLSALAVADEETGAGVVPVLIKDGSGRSVHATDAAWVQKMPDAEDGKEITDREWVLDCARITNFIGGNTAQSGSSE